MGTDIFAYHGFVELHLDNAWIKATPAFNLEIYKKHHIAPVDFNGKDDAIFPSHDLHNNPYVEYLTFHGSFHDLPLEQILRGWRNTYGDDRVDAWIQLMASA
jgi:hypothetical protein